MRLAYLSLISPSMFAWPYLIENSDDGFFFRDRTYFEKANYVLKGGRKRTKQEMGLNQGTIHWFKRYPFCWSEITICFALSLLHSYVHCTLDQSILK